MRRREDFLLARGGWTLGVVAWICLCVSAPAAVMTTGDVQPNPAASGSGDDLYVGKEDEGTMAVDGGSGVHCKVGFVGFKWSVDGLVTVDGPGASWTMAEQLYVGFDGNGHMSVRNGAGVTNTFCLIADDHRSVSGVTVSGRGSTWTSTGNLYVGFDGAGAMTVEQGAAVTCAQGMIGDKFGSSGQVTITGGQSRWTNTTGLVIGYAGEGSLRVEDGASLASATCTLGSVFEDAVGLAVIRGPGATWTTQGYLTIGFAGQGSVVIEDGAAVTNARGRLAGRVGSTGEVTVIGPGSSWHCGGNVEVAYAGFGRLKLINGGSVRTDADAWFAEEEDAVGEIWFAIGPDGSGRLDVAGDLVLNRDGHDRLKVTLEAGFTPTHGRTYDLIDWDGALAGRFDAVELEALPGGLLWDTSRLHVDGTIRVVPEPAALLLAGMGALALRRRRARRARRA